MFELNLVSPQKRVMVNAVLSIVCLLSICVLGFYGPIGQDPLYHLFADQRVLFGVNNFWNVVSNVPFFVIGLLGLRHFAARASAYCLKEGWLAYCIFFAGVMMTGLSSAFYHHSPNNGTLFWDRLTMALSFMAFLDVVIGSLLSWKLARTLLGPLVAFGVFSVVYWMMTEQHGAGDLRLYAVVQFFPVLIVPVLVFLFNPTEISRFDISVIGSGYLFAKILEFLDGPMYQFAGISGHSLKHLAAAFSAFWVLRVVRQGRHSCSIQKNGIKGGTTYEDCY